MPCYVLIRISDHTANELEHLIIFQVLQLPSFERGGAEAQRSKRRYLNQVLLH